MGVIVEVDSAVLRLVLDQMVAVQAKHPGLEAVFDGRLAFVRGNIGFQVTHGDCTVEDAYDIELRLPDTYPGLPPIAFETAGRIGPDFEHLMPAGNLCLGTPVEIRRRFAQHKTLIGFISDQLVPYLFSCSYKRMYGKMPFSDRPHGVPGLLDFYMEDFTASPLATLKLLKRLADDVAPPRERCPCGSGLELRRCHGPKLDALRPYYSPRLFEEELRAILAQAKAAGIDLPERAVLPKRMWRSRRKRTKQKRRR